MAGRIGDRAGVLVGDIRAARRTGPLKEMVSEFIQLVECLPGYPVGEVTADDIGRITADAEQVIEKIEQWITTKRLDRKDEQRLAAAVYAIRDAVEEVDHWRRHYLGA